MEPLTKKEEEIMQIIWTIKHGFISDIIDGFDEPKPHKNTLATLVKILVEKGFVKYEIFGRMHRYSPTISKMAYRKFLFTNFVSNYFEGSYEKVVSFMVNEENLSESDIAEMQQIIEDTQKNQERSNL